MAARGSKSAQQRTEAERARRHAARTEWHDSRIRRRVRDNTIASIAGAVIVLAAVGSQVVHAQVAPPAPEPTPTVEPTDAPAPTDTTAPEPAPTETPAEESPVEETPAG
ncbi:hypothetical protein [Microbacterium sp. H83]|uniref:hypothetical protein n=1 Tax=Microbacterium sp. H83 TaxID=1827324 RepID=UPI0007F46582|nr:hypothetical protein [Microbacterium sp. H83]OAN41005.1 hypothetical protein A4X16_02425 [Microbacterium sp. H83]